MSDRARDSMEIDRESTQRFSDRVANYVRYRPGYPRELVEAIRGETDLPDGGSVADVGSGTGISTGLFLDFGYTVYAVEPNGPMRSAAEDLLAGRHGFTSIAGTAEHTTLPDHSVDLVAAGQAFHWFDPSLARTEFARILRGGRLVSLFWNTRRTEGSPFLNSYEHLLRSYGTDYSAVDHLNITPDRLHAFFGKEFRSYSFPNEQVFDYEGLEGRLLSASYTPGPEHPFHAPMLAELRRIFDAHEVGGRVQMLYDIELHIGQLG